MAKPKEKEKVDQPVKTSFTIDRIGEGWVFSTITYKGDKILNVESTEPDLKALIIEKFKIAAFKYWSSIG